MGNCLLPPEAREKAKRSREVDEMLNRHHKFQASEIKLLLLGKYRPVTVAPLYDTDRGGVTTKRSWRIWQKYYLQTNETPDARGWFHRGGAGVLYPYHLQQLHLSNEDPGI